MQTTPAARSPARNVPYGNSPASTGVPSNCNTSAPAAGGVRRVLRRNEEIFAEGDEAEFFYKIVSGEVRTYKLTNDGRRQIDAFHFAGDVIALQPSGKYLTFAEAIGETIVVSYRRSALRTIAGSDTEFAEQMMATMTRDLEHAREHMVVLGCKNAHEKIATFLLGLAARLAASDCVELPMMRSDIADHLGLTIETVSRTMAELARDGVIALDARHRRIILRDRATLLELSA